MSVHDDYDEDTPNFEMSSAENTRSSRSEACRLTCSSSLNPSLAVRAYSAADPAASSSVTVEFNNDNNRPPLQTTVDLNASRKLVIDDSALESALSRSRVNDLSSVSTTTSTTSTRRRGLRPAPLFAAIAASVAQREKISAAAARIKQSLSQDSNTALSAEIAALQEDPLSLAAHSHSIISGEETNANDSSESLSSSLLDTENRDDIPSPRSQAAYPILFPDGFRVSNNDDNSLTHAAECPFLHHSSHSLQSEQSRQSTIQEAVSVEGLSDGLRSLSSSRSSFSMPSLPSRRDSPQLTNYSTVLASVMQSLRRPFVNDGRLEFSTPSSTSSSSSDDSSDVENVEASEARVATPSSVSSSSSMHWHPVLRARSPIRLRFEPAPLQQYEAIDAPVPPRTRPPLPVTPRPMPLYAVLTGASQRNSSNPIYDLGANDLLYAFPQSGSSTPPSYEGNTRSGYANITISGRMSARDPPHMVECGHRVDSSLPYTHVAAQRLIVAKPISAGHFGHVWMAFLQESDESPNAFKRVAVKFFPSKSVAAQNEALIAQKLDHENIVAFHGACFKHSPCFAVFEYLDGQNLHQYLVSNKTFAPEDRTAIPVEQVVDFSLQISAGMLYLSSKNIIHRDLAARNIIKTRQGLLKIIDFGLSSETEELRQSSRHAGAIPWGWSAYESLPNNIDGDFRLIWTTMSDVWSFGVVVWEMLTGGAQPYLNVAALRASVDQPDIATYLKSGKRLHVPDETPNAIANMLRQCWMLHASSRPSFITIHQQFQMLVNSPQALMQIGYDLDLFCKDQDVEPFLCSICQLVFNNPVTAPCGHSFCRHCIHQWLATRMECPVDRSHLSRTRLNPSLALRNLILKLQVQCITCEDHEGHGWAGSFEQWQAHMLSAHEQFV